MSDIEQAPPGVDPTIPTPARLYDHYLGGKDNYAADRAAAARLREQMPELEDAAWANRGFLQRAVRDLADRGIRQFLDIGSGLPTQNNTHQVARSRRPDARVVYVDNDPAVLAHARALLAQDRPGGDGASGPRTAVITGDLRRPEEILGHDATRRTLDLREPVGLLVVAVTHFLSDEDDPWARVRCLLDGLAPGSHLALSAGTGDHQSPRALKAIDEVYSNSTAKVYLRGRADIARFFDGLELLPPYPGAEPSMAFLGVWGADDPEAADSDGSRWGYCGVARLP
ncbi:SAM-dependent methyltransferase [Spirillospora sp. CA-255316]